VPDCAKVPVDTPVKFRLTSTDVIHGSLLPATNVNTMVMPGFVAEVRTKFNRAGVYNMPCHEFCGDGHHGMWARVSVLPKEQFPQLTAVERTVAGAIYGIVAASAGANHDLVATVA
jgi:cytochrome c oxidase subunit II